MIRSRAAAISGTCSVNDPHPPAHPKRVLRPQRQHRRPAKARQVDQLHQVPVLDHHRTHAPGTRRALRTGLDLDPQLAPTLGHIKDRHVAEADQQLTHGNRIR